MKYKYSSGNRSSDSRTENSLGFDTGFKIFQDERLLVNSVSSSKVFNIINVGVPRTWILLESQSKINVFCDCKLLSEVVNMEGAMVIHCNVGVVHTYLSGVILRFEQETRLYYPQVINIFTHLSLARKHFHIT